MCAGWTPFESVPQIPSTYVYLRNDSTGRHVGAEPDGTVKMHEHCGDDCMWLLEEAGGSYQLRSATTELVLEGQSAEPVVAPYGEKGVAMTLAGIRDLFPSKPEESEAENPMMAAMGIPLAFDSTAGKEVKDPRCKVEGVRKKEQRKYRQYMNRRGGFNRPLEETGGSGF